MNVRDLREYAKSKLKQAHPTEATFAKPSKDAKTKAKIV